MALQLPSTLKLAQLKQLAFKCGISTSGTKPILSRRLLDEIQSQDGSKKAPKPMRILSIDMGIRNLAYCVLDVPFKPISLPGSSKSTPKLNHKDLPSIHAWHRLSVSRAPVPSSSTSLEILPIAKEAFDPGTLSSIAYSLLRFRLLTTQPTHILIERQRFRSMGSKHILEWTVRVNMFESMIYAVLCTLKEEGLWKGSVGSVLPGKVGPFWVGEEAGEGEFFQTDGKGEDGGEEKTGKGKKKVRKSQSAKVRNKGLKIDLVRSWLEDGDVVQLGNERVELVARAYMEKWDRLPGGKKGKRGVEEGERMGKLDDLADCLLQGMAWVKWEENKRLLGMYGVEALLEP